MMSQRESSMHIYLPLLLFISTALAADQSPLVSEGTCYYEAGKQADSVYIPCGNDAFGVYACCMHGDDCLSSNACYNAQYGNVYIAGCTDPTYSDSVCGNKGLYSDLQWASLVRCYVSNDTSVNEEEWATCDESGQPIVTTHDGGCVCTASAHTAVFTDNPNLTNVGVLPDATGKTISFGPGHTPPSDLTPTSHSVSSTSSPSPTNSASSANSISSTTMASSTSSRKSSTSKAATTSSTEGTSDNSTTDSASSSTSTNAPAFKGLSTAAEAGIGVGVGLGVLLACAILFLLYRRRLKEKYQLEARYLPAPKEPARTESLRSPAWSGYKSELSAAEQRSELLASTHPSSLALSSATSELDGTSVMARVYHGVKLLYTSSTASGQGESHSSRTHPDRYSQSITSARISTIHELPGS